MGGKRTPYNSCGALADPDFSEDSVSREQKERVSLGKPKVSNATCNYK